jgi:6-phosphogluconolactonase
MWRRLLLTIGFCAAFAGSPARADDLVYFGSRTAERGEGVFAARFDSQSGRLTPLGTVAQIARPTWLSAHPTAPVLYAVSEVGNDGSVEASVTSLAVDRVSGALRVLNTVDSGGGGATHIAVDAPSRTLFVANYGTGQVSWLPILADGRLGMPMSVQSTFGTGPHERQDGPHPHGVEVDPSHRYVLVSDLGADRTFVFRFDPATRQMTPGRPAFTAVAPGAGPRLLTFHPKGRLLFVLTQMTAELVTYRWDAARGRMTHLTTIPTETPLFKGAVSGANLAVSQDGRFVYVSNRGSNSLSAYALTARNGQLREIQRISSQGALPMSFSIHPGGRWMLVANNGSNAIAVFAVDPVTGKLTATGQAMPAPQPASVTFLPGPN